MSVSKTVNAEHTPFWPPKQGIQCLSAALTGRCRLLQPDPGGSFIFVRLVAVMTPMPSATITPTAIQRVGTSSMYAAMASPRTRMTKPTTYVAKLDMMANGAGKDGASQCAVRRAPCLLSSGATGFEVFPPTRPWARAARGPQRPYADPRVGLPGTSASRCR
jgi:hypothetical protein